MDAVNSAFLSKLTWKLFYHQGLWVDQMQVKHQLDEFFFAIKPKKMDFWVWKCLLKIRQQFRKIVWWKVGNGLNINFWLDNWCANDSLANLLQVTDHSLIDTFLKISHFISITKEWDIVKLNSVVDLVHLQLIIATPLPTNPFPDSVCWGLSGNGNFFTKTATWAAHGLDLIHRLVWKYNWLWKLDIVPKLKIFLWQLCHLSLPAKETLSKQGLNIDPVCPFC